MIESKEHLYDYGESEPVQKENTPFIIPNYEYRENDEGRMMMVKSNNDSNAEIDFSLTMNEEDVQKCLKPEFKN